MEHTSEIVNQIQTLLDFLSMANGVPIEEPEQHSIDMEGNAGEIFRIIKSVNPIGKYHTHISDKDGERNIESENIPSLKHILDILNFPVIEISYYYGVNPILTKQFENSETNLTVEVINVDTMDKSFILGVANSKIELTQKCLKNYQLIEYLGKGSYGTIYKACINKECKYAIKIIIIGGPGGVLGQIPAVFNHETDIIRKFSENNIGPKFYEAWMCKLKTGFTLGFVVTELWDGNLRYNECLSSALQKKLLKQILKINELGYIHGDIFARNVLVKREGKNIADATLTDFGLVEKIEKWKDVMRSEMGEVFYNNQITDPQNKYYFINKKISLKDVINDPRNLDLALYYYLKRCKN